LTGKLNRVCDAIVDFPDADYIIGIVSGLVRRTIGCSFERSDKVTRKFFIADLKFAVYGLRNFNNDFAHNNIYFRGKINMSG
jgi:hypothetical protein